MSMKKILLIIPAYNEEEAILETCQSIFDFNKQHGCHYDVLVINDCSKDNTPKILVDNNISHIDLVHNLGIGGAVQTGYKYAYQNGYDIAIQFDGDGQHDINSVTDLIAPIINGEADFTVGSRFVENSKSEFKSSAARRMGIKLISFFIKLATGKVICDTTSGYRAANKKIISDFANVYPIEYPEPITNAELLKKGYRVKEVSVLMHERSGGTSSIHSWKNVYYMVNILLSIIVVGLRRYSK